jgi:ATP-binding cassette subfamily B protein
MAMAHLDHAGVGTLELRSDQRLLATWRFTLGHNPAALRLLAEFDRALAEPMADSAASGPAAEDEHDLPDVDEEEGADEKPPSTWTLLRLWRFAHPTAGAAGRLLLTLAGTAATLVPPYLTIPLMDEVLIPFQNGKQIDPRYVALLLSGLLGSALLAWALGWAKTYILALVSERIGADLRTTTYEHLLGCRWSISAASAPAT